MALAAVSDQDFWFAVLFGAFGISSLQAMQGEKAAAASLHTAATANEMASDREFLAALRAAIERYFAVVDQWESAYFRYYRMPDTAQRSGDLAGEQREFENARRALELLLPRARVLASNMHRLTSSPDFPGSHSVTMLHSNAPIQPSAAVSVAPSWLA